MYVCIILHKTYSKPTKTATVMDNATIDIGVKVEVNTPKDFCWTADICEMNTVVLNKYRDNCVKK